MPEEVSTSNLRWLCSKFESLSTNELYSLLKLRAEVFIVEQDCNYQDLDGKDQVAFHLLGTQGSDLCCYARLIPPGISYDEASIGRIVTSSKFRGTGIGKLLVAECIRQCKILWPDSAITISAQHYLERFYHDYGFTTESEPYQEDGIPHIRMQLASS